jgi:hypothetical protein
MRPQLRWGEYKSIGVLVMIGIRETAPYCQRVRIGGRYVEQQRRSQILVIIKALALL